MGQDNLAESCSWILLKEPVLYVLVQDFNQLHSIPPLKSKILRHTPAKYRRPLQLTLFFASQIDPKF